MIKCRHCSWENADTSRFCGSCGAPLDLTSAPTQSMGSMAAARLEEERFLPGTLINGRYRVMGLVGRGGMGEVYRATDLALGQQVALKFLPESAGQHDLARFHAEVRVARQVSHPNVCRVYDIGEVNGQPFLSMEYVDGEDLGSLLRRIGRLPPDKAAEIARRLCAGLAAAHDKGVLHRDLKPANIMIDGRGQVVITDFGLAAAVHEIQDTASGTPAYMSPEQLAGKEVTARSDIYALGLVLYEMYTGRHLEAENRASPSSRDLDPAVERIIRQCLDPEPRNRPLSALSVAAALPGGDPLAAALAAGETPSPELVAAAGEGEAMPLRAAWAALALVVLGTLPMLWLAWDFGLVRRVPLDRPPDALAERGRLVAERLGFERPFYQTSGFNYNFEYIGYARRTGQLVAPPDFPGPMSFWYRQSPQPLTPTTRYGPWSGFSDPPFDRSGMVRMVLDSRGRLRSLDRMPPERGASRPGTPAPDWNPLFAAAGLDPAVFSPTAPEVTPLTAFDSRAAWTGPAGPYTVRVEAAAWQGTPVSFRIVGPWSRQWRTEPRPAGGARRMRMDLLQALFLVLLSTGCALAWRNLKSGRGDWRGAWRIAGVISALGVVSWALTTNHVSGMGEIEQFWVAVGRAGVDGATLWLFYIALEPYVRRRWPHALIGWSRLLAGRFRDAVVGRDVLIGMASMVLFGLLECLHRWIELQMGHPVPNVNPATLRGMRHALGLLCSDVYNATFQVLFVFFLLVLLRALLRREWLAAVAFVAILGGAFAGVSDDPLLGMFIEPAFFAGVFFLLVRFGVLATVVGHFAGRFLLLRWPVTLDFSAWYAGVGLFALTLVLVLTLLAFRAATTGHRLFSADWIDK